MAIEVEAFPKLPDPLKKILKFPGFIGWRVRGLPCGPQGAGVGYSDEIEHSYLQVDFYWTQQVGGD